MTTQYPPAIVDVRRDGDTILVMSNMTKVEQLIGIRVSSYALRNVSPVFEQILTTSATEAPDAPGQKLVQLPDDDGDAMFLLCNVLHLRNDALPPRVQPEALYGFAALTAKYDCVVAAGRAATPWFDHVFNNSVNPPLLRMIEAAYLLDDAVFFARFTSRWILTSDLTTNTVVHSATSVLPAFVAAKLYTRRMEAIANLRMDLDLIVDPCAQCLSEDMRHDIDIPPDENLSEEFLKDDPRVPCVVDREGAIEYLSALRDANLWPPTRWPNTVEAIVRSFRDFGAPVYDNSDSCIFCLNVVQQFDMVLEQVREMHRSRLWGLCLDCFNAGGVYTGECRHEHVKQPRMPLKAIKPQATFGTVEELPKQQE